MTPIALTQITFEFDNGDGVGKVVPMPAVTVRDGNWHDLVFTKTDITGDIILDGVRVGRSNAPQGRMSVDIFAPLYFGGVPRMWQCMCRFCLFML